MALKQAVLHLGFHKTGSTSIQHGLGQHAAFCTQHGWHYPVFHYSDAPIFNHSIALFGLYSKNAARYHIYRKQKWCLNTLQHKFRQQWADALAQNRNLLVSAEDVSNFSVSVLQRLKTDLESAGYRIRPIAFVRSPLQDCSSRAQERVKTGKGIQDAVQTNSFARYSTLKKVQRLKEVFPVIEFHRFDAVKQHDGEILAQAFPDQAAARSSSNGNRSRHTCMPYPAFMC